MIPKFFSYNVCVMIRAASKLRFTSVHAPMH
jgi:hypothetical protein